MAHSRTSMPKYKPPKIIPVTTSMQLLSVADSFQYTADPGLESLLVHAMAFRTRSVCSRLPLQCRHAESTAHRTSFSAKGLASTS